MTVWAMDGDRAVNVNIDSKEILKARGLPRDGENRWVSRRDRIAG